ncbi:MAG: signal peptidase I [Micropruina sp.]|uniref:signal peptidase I n=1 Tax=Micropruina sp. TaxID=2737536 RepID=UPI0039E337EB
MSESAPSEKSEKPSAGRVAGMWAKEIAIVVIGALVASTLLRLFIAQMFVIPSGSMENTLLIRDRVMVQKVAGWSRGDVVVFRDTQGWLADPEEETDPVRKALIFIGLAPDESSNHLIKRVIGLPGDHVKCCDSQGRITVNDDPLDETSYLYSSNGETVEPSAMSFDVVVPKDRIWVMGDHRNDSQDSRCHLTEGTGGMAAFVPIADVVGSAVAVVFPFDRWRGLSRPDTFAQVPEPASPAPDRPVIAGQTPVC